MRFDAGIVVPLAILVAAAAAAAWLLSGTWLVSGLSHTDVRLTAVPPVGQGGQWVDRSVVSEAEELAHARGSRDDPARPTGSN